MAEEAGETVGRFLEAFNSSRYDVCLEMLDPEVTGVYTVRDGKVVRLRTFADKASALSAIGFTE